MLILLWTEIITEGKAADRVEKEEEKPAFSQIEPCVLEL
jgi:hypothetical protein